MPAEPPDDLPKPSQFADRPVERPLLIFDGNCGFCRRTVERIREITGDRADYASSQEVGADFPSILPEEYLREVKLVETDGQVYGAAEAALRLIFDAGKSPWSGVPLWAYRQVPGVRWASETGYHFVATHRTLCSTLVRWLWGNDLRRATFQNARTWFLRALGAIYFIAFLSLRVQVDGLIGKDGILPVAPLLDDVRARKGVAWGVFHLPSLGLADRRERRGAAFPVQRRHGPGAAARRGSGSGVVLGAAVGVLPFAGDRGADLSGLPVGYSPAGSGFPEHFPGAAALVDGVASPDADRVARRRCFCCAGCCSG